VTARRAAVALALLALAALPAGASAFAPVSVPVPSRGGVTYAAGRLLWTTHTAHGPIVVRQRPLAGGAASVLAAIPRAHPSSRAVELGLAANGSGYVVTARDLRSAVTDECGCGEHVEGHLVARGGYDGSLQTVLSCVPAAGADVRAFYPVAGTSGFAFGGAGCGASAPVETIGADGAVTPFAAFRLPGNGSGYGLSYAEPFLAAGSLEGGVRVVDTRDGSARDRRLPARIDATRVAVQPDGTLVLGPGDGAPSRVYVWAPDAAAPHAVPGARLSRLGGFRAAGGRLLFAGPRLGLGLIGLDGAGLTTVGAPGAGGEREPVAFDGRVAAFTSVSCAGRARLTVVDLTEPAPPHGSAGCPVEVRGRRVMFSRRGRGTLRVVCRNGCRGDLSLALDLRRGELSRRELDRYLDRTSDSDLARGRLRLPASARTRRVTVRLARPALALLRRHHRRLHAFVSLGENQGPELATPRPQLVVRLGL
jgi:hypothetical protein